VYDAAAAFLLPDCDLTEYPVEHYDVVKSRSSKHPRNNAGAFVRTCFRQRWRGRV